MVETVTQAAQAVPSITMNWTQMQQYLLEAGASIRDFANTYTIKAAALRYGFQAMEFNGAIMFFKTATAAENMSNALATGSASGLFNSFVQAGGELVTKGAATVSSAFSNVTLAVKEGIATVTGLLSVPIPTAWAAIAPILGVAGGIALYKSNPELWTKISRALLPFCYPDTQNVKVTVDEQGNTYFPQGAIDAVKSVLRQEKILAVLKPNDRFLPVYTGDDWLNGNTVYRYGTYFMSSKYPGYATTHYTARVLTCKSRIAIGRILKLPKKVGNDYDGAAVIAIDPDGLMETTAEYRRYSIDNHDLGGHAFELWSYAGYYGKYFWCVLENTPIDSSDEITFPDTLLEFPDVASMVDYFYNVPSTIPTGLSEWTGQAANPTAPTLDIVTEIRDDGTTATEPYYPVALPTGDPGISSDPETNPNPNYNPNPAPVITPFITPNPGPELWPSEYPTAQPDEATEPWPEDYPYPDIQFSPLPDPTVITIPVTVADPATDPEATPETETETQYDIPVTQETEIPTDIGSTQEPEIVVTPSITSNAGGLLTVYNPSASELINFGKWMWTTWSGNVADTLQKMFLNHPLDGVIGLHEYYATPDTNGRNTIKCGFLDSEIEADVVQQRYTAINCGNILIPEYYGNYLDYSPYTQASAYLPFVGIVNLNADDVVGHAVNVTYYCDAYTGSVIAMITCANATSSALLYQFEGNASVQIPLTSGNQLGLVTSAISAAGSGLIGALSGGIAGGMAATATSLLHAATSPKASVSHSGAFGGAFGAMGLKKPYLIIRRPVQKIASQYHADYGYPAHKRVKLSDCSGYVRAIEVNVTSATATSEEKRMIADLLKSGVYV
ncbi:MAG: hypothetical protein IJQ81_15340 [Oscillibacter sp.]|nr:hypothetical protein [Oscillibacter sp.]